MLTKLKSTLLLIIGLCCTWAHATDSTVSATYQEVIEKVHEAADLLTVQGERGLEILRDNTCRFTWKDSYLFVIDLEKGLVLANPAFREREGGNICEHLDFEGKRYGLELCAVAEKPGGGWIEYIWPRPGTSKPLRKVSYIYPVPDTPYVVCAGIYDDNSSIEQLKRLSDLYVQELNSQKASPVAVIFEVYPDYSGRDEYLKIAAKLKAELQKIEGFISIERFKSLSDEGKILSLSFWESEKAVAQWRNQEEHRKGQKAGHDGLFKDYKISVARVIRTYTLNERAQAPADSNAYLEKQ
jgi:heme-degrading monooxygenase HmoA